MAKRKVRNIPDPEPVAPEPVVNPPERPAVIEWSLVTWLALYDVPSGMQEFRSDPSVGTVVEVRQLGPFIVEFRYTTANGNVSNRVYSGAFQLEFAPPPEA